jgi:hypothetical protein
VFCEPDKIRGHARPFDIASYVPIVASRALP